MRSQCNNLHENWVITYQGWAVLFLHWRQFLTLCYCCEGEGAKDTQKLSQPTQIDNNWATTMHMQHIPQHSTLQLCMDNAAINSKWDNLDFHGIWTTIETKGRQLHAANSIKYIRWHQKDTQPPTEQQTTNGNKHVLMQHKCDHNATICLEIGWLLTYNKMFYSSPKDDFHYCPDAAKDKEEMGVKNQVKHYESMATGQQQCRCNTCNGTAPYSCAWIMEKTNQSEIT